jgi:hypothetical protein
MLIIKNELEKKFRLIQEKRFQYSKLQCFFFLGKSSPAAAHWGGGQVRPAPALLSAGPAASGRPSAGPQAACPPPAAQCREAGCFLHTHSRRSFFIHASQFSGMYMLYIAQASTHRNAKARGPILSPWLRGIKLTMTQGCRTGPSGYIGWRTGMLTLCHSQLDTPLRDYEFDYRLNIRPHKKIDVRVWDVHKEVRVYL